MTIKKRDEIKEIEKHIENLLEEKTNKQDIFEKNIETKLLEWKEITEEDIFKIENKNDEIITRMDINLNTRICDLCKKTINLENNLSGLVIHDSHFLCEECCEESSKEELDNWTTSKMAKPGDLKPVALWLMKEKNKNNLL